MKIRFAWPLAALLAASTAGAVEVDLPGNLREAEVFGGLGVGNFTRNLGDVTNSGLAWDARAGVQILRNVGAEINYQGLRGDVGTIVRQPGPVLITGENLTQHALTVDGKLSYPVMVRDRELRPYGLVGLGWSTINSNSTLQTVGLGDDDQFAIPVGAGASYLINDTFMVDGRFVYNFLSGIDLPLVDDSASSWTAAINVGARFGAAD